VQVPTCDQIGYALNVARALAKSLASPNACQEVLGVVILQDTRELKCAAPDCVALRTKPGVVALADLVHSTLRLRPDRIIVGEVRGPEALDMFKAWNTGHRGGITTVHATLAAAGLHRLEQLVQEAVVTLPRELAIALAGKVGRVGSYSYDVYTEKLKVSEGYAALHGLPEGTTETTLSEWRARVHPEDLVRVERVHDQAVADQRHEYSVEYRIVRLDGEVRWTERRCLISYNRDSRPQRVVGVSIDITERQQAEKQRNILNAELDHRVKNVLATVGAIIFQTQHANATIEDFVWRPVEFPSAQTRLKHQ
jgi:PAS domain S-box-containing protein